jgi:pimeloyl-ACP methyl ester carboxylesterase
MWIVRLALNRPYIFIVLALLIVILSPEVILKVNTMNSNEKDLRLSAQQDTVAIVTKEDKSAISNSAISRRTFLAGSTAVGASLLFGRVARANSFGGFEGPPIKESDIATNGISLHVAEQGEGPAVLFCHGFPDTSYTWRRQMNAVASAGYRAIAPDMRGYGRSSAPADAALYTPLHTAGDLVGLLDALNIPSAVIVGHDWGASHAWNAALMRPDRFKAVFCMSVPYVPRGDVSVFERMRKSGHQNDFYMFEQMKPEADQIWADASVTIPGILYWASGSAPVETRWDPMNPARSLHRPAPGPLPSWAEPDYVTHNIAEFQRTGFHGALNYYRAAEPYFYLSGAWKGAKVTQPSFYIAGKADGLEVLYPPVDTLRAGLPGLVGNLEIDNVGHWVQHEASAQVNERLVKFLRTVIAA